MWKHFYLLGKCKEHFRRIGSTQSCFSALSWPIKFLPHRIVRAQLCRYLAVARLNPPQEGKLPWTATLSWTRKIKPCKWLTPASSNIKERQSSEKQSSSSLPEIVHHEKPIHKQTTNPGYLLSEINIQDNSKTTHSLNSRILVLIACITPRQKNLPGVTLFFGVSDKLDIQTWNPIIGQPWKKKVIRDTRKQSKSVISESLRVSKGSFKRDIKFFLRVVLAWWGLRGRSSHKNHTVNFYVLVDLQNLWNWSVGDPVLSSKSKICPELIPSSSEDTYQETVWLIKPQNCKTIYLCSC